MNKIVIVINLLVIIQSTYALSCIKCESSQHEICHFLQPKTIATECAGGLPEGTEDRCFIQFTEMGVTIRGCLSENPHLLEVCEHGTGTCRICFEDQCNIDQTMREVCSICDSITDPNCASSPFTFLHVCPFFYEYEAGGCYLHKRNDGTLERGCIVTGTTDFINLCQTGEECKVCRGQTCNTKVDFQECHVCDSENDGYLTCLRSPANSPTKVCQNYGDYCAELVVTNGKTVRDCYQELDGSISTLCPGNNCQVCFDNNCNNNIFPSDRLTCHQCTDAENCHKDMTSIGSEAYPCRNYAPNDQCYTVLDGNTVFRGCMSDRTQEQAVCEASGDLCKKCTEQGCNVEEVEVPTEPLERIWCHQCQGNGTSDCAYRQSWTKSMPCTSDLEVGRQEQCYVSRTVSGGGLDYVRGCTGDKHCDISECLVCNHWHCNWQSRAEMRCIQCSSLPNKGDYREECLEEPERVYYPSDCPLDDNYSIEDTGCYSIRLQTIVDGKSVPYVQRGCKYRMEVDSRCNDDEDKSCVICQGHLCNIHDVGLGTKLSVSGTILILLLTMLNILS
uniref:Putative conserved secreted protein n=1 Tax=Nyssomyia neivai TaxID=330878 RepID=A0A1L8DPC4_9DIPT